MFVREFPSPLAARANRYVHTIAIVALVVGGLCAAANLSLVFAPVSALDDWRTPLLKETVAGGWSWPLVLALSLLAVPVLLWRARTAAADERPRVRLFVRGLALGLTPFALEVVAEGLFPAYSAFTSREPAHTVVATVLFGSLATVPFVTAYSVIFDRVVEVRVVLRAALQHMFARSMIVTLTLIPFAALALFLYTQRAQALASLFAGPRPLLLLGAAALGLAALQDAPPLAGRHRPALLPRTLRRAADSGAIVRRSACRDHRSSWRRASPTSWIGRSMSTPTCSWPTTPGRRCATPVANGRRWRRRPRWWSSPWNDPMPMDVDLADPSSALHRLPEAEKRWILTNGVHLLVALKSGDGKLAGVLALSGETQRPGVLGRSIGNWGRPRCRRPRAWRSTTCGCARRRSRPADPAARECLHCSRLNPADSEVMWAAAARRRRRRCRTCCAAASGSSSGGRRRDGRGLSRPRSRPGARGRHQDAAADGRRAAPRLRKEARAMAWSRIPTSPPSTGSRRGSDMPFLVEEYLGRAAPSPTSLSAAAAVTRRGAAARHHPGRRPSNTSTAPASCTATSSRATSASPSRRRQAARFRAGAPAARAPGVLAAGSSPRTSPVEDAPTLVAASASGAFAGTPHYMSPEAVQGGRPSPVYDVWGLSVVLFEAIAGHRPFDGATGPEISAG